MRSEPERHGWSVASPSEIERTARDLAGFRHRFFTSADADGRFVRPLILRSWQRCRAMRVDESRRIAPLAVTRDVQLRAILDASEALLRAAREVIVRLRDQLVDSGYVIVLTNADGCILSVDGDRDIQRRLARIDFVVGGDWSESAAGTNAIGTALRDRRSVQLLAAEHFCDGWTDLTCTAVPIHDPFSGDVLGALDVTGNYRLIRVHLTSLLAVSALEIEDRLRNLHVAGGASAFALSAVAPPREFVDDNVLLTFASGAIGASLDLQATIRTIAEQTALVLRAQATALLLFAADGQAEGMSGRRPAAARTNCSSRLSAGAKRRRSFASVAS